MRKLKIYLAGKMSGLTFDEMNEWRRLFKKKLLKINSDYGYGYELTIINPVDYYNFNVLRHQNEKEVRDFDLKNATSSDIIVVNLDGLNTSDGTKIEIHDCSYYHNIPIVVFGDRSLYDNLHPWIKEDITRVEKNMDDVIEYITDFYMHE